MSRKRDAQRAKVYAGASHVDGLMRYPRLTQEQAHALMDAACRRYGQRTPHLKYARRGSRHSWYRSSWRTGPVVEIKATIYVDADPADAIRQGQIRMCPDCRAARCPRYSPEQECPPEHLRYEHRAMAPDTVLHETAHHLTRGDQLSHGPRFARVELDLLAWYTGQPMGQLKAEYRRGGAKIARKADAPRPVKAVRVPKIVPRPTLREEVTA